MSHGGASEQANGGGTWRDAQDALDAFVTTQLLDNSMDTIIKKINHLKTKLYHVQELHRDIDDKTKKKWTKQLQFWLAVACCVLAKQRDELNACINTIDGNVKRGIIGTSATAAKPSTPVGLAHPLMPHLNTNGVLPMPATEPVIVVGCHVAAKVARSHELWILARVVRFDEGASVYEVEDVDSGEEEELDGGGGERRHHIVPWHQVVEMPGDTMPADTWIQYAVNQRVMAMYPNTTSFFRGTIRVPNPKGAPCVILKFDEDENEFGQVPDRKVPFRFVAPLKPWHYK